MSAQTAAGLLGAASGTPRRGRLTAASECGAGKTSTKAIMALITEHAYAALTGRTAGRTGMVQASADVLQIAFLTT